MKRIYRILMISAALLLSTACHKEYDGPSMRSVKINVAENAWQYSGVADNNYFFATVQMPEINAAVFKQGLVKMYRVYDWDKDNAAQTELPFVRLNELENTDGEWIFFTETIDYQFEPGQVTIFYTTSDFNYELVSFNPGPMAFRCVVVY